MLWGSNSYVKDFLGVITNYFSLLFTYQITQHKWAWPFMKPVDVEGLGLHDYYEVKLLYLSKLSDDIFMWLLICVHIVCSTFFCTCTIISHLKRCEVLAMQATRSQFFL